MEKIINIDGKEVAFKCTGTFLLKYKAQFNTDALKDIYKIQNIIDKNGNFNDIDSEIMYQLIWTLAKTADPTIKPLMEWLDSFDSFPLIEVFNEVIILIFSCIYSGVKPKKK